MTSERRVVIFVNPKAGSGAGKSAVERLVEELGLLGFEVIKQSDLIDFQDLLANDPESLSAVISAGGDGTAELVANQITQEIPLGILPLGTENLLAKYLGIECDPKKLAATVAAGKTRPFDAGLANQQMFLLMLSCGFDADVVQRLHQDRAGNITHLSYAAPIIESIRNYEYPSLSVSCEGEGGWEVEECHWAFVFNAPVYAGGLKIVSDADPSDGELEVATFAGGSFWHGLWQFSAVMLGQHHQLPGFRIQKAKRVRIESPVANVPYQGDGDPGGSLPVEIEVLPQRLTLLTP